MTIMKMTDIKKLGDQIRIAVATDSRTREAIVVSVQDLLRPKGASFSLAGLDKLCKGIAPKKDTKAVLDAVLEVLKIKA